MDGQRVKGFRNIQILTWILILATILSCYTSTRYYVVWLGFSGI